LLDRQIYLDSLRGTPNRLAGLRVVFWWTGPTDLGRPKLSHKGIGVNTPTARGRRRRVREGAHRLRRRVPPGPPRPPGCCGDRARGRRGGPAEARDLTDCNAGGGGGEEADSSRAVMSVQGGHAQTRRRAGLAAAAATSGPSSG